MLSNLTIKLKLILSFGIIALLILIMAIYSDYAVGQSSEGFSEYREMARDNNLAGQINTNMLLARGSVKDYISSKSQKDADAFQTYLDETKKLVKEAKKEIKNPTRAPLVEKIDNSLESYRKNFLELVNYMKKRDDIKKNGMDTNGKEAEEFLTTLLKTSKNDNELLYEASIGLRSLLIARLYAAKFLETNDEIDFKRVNEEFSNINEALNNLKSKFKDSTKISLLNKAIEAAKNYNLAVKDIHHTIIDRNKLIIELVAIGKVIGDSSEAVKTSLKKDQDAIGPKVAKLNDNTKMMIEVISFVIMALIILIAIYVPRDIASMISKFQEGLLNFFKYLNREIPDVEPIDIHSHSEIGVMAKVVNENIEKTKAGIDEDRKVISDTITVLNEFEQGDLCQRVQSSTTNPALQELTALLNKMADNIEKNIDNVLDVLEQYSNYNYMSKADTNDLKEHLLKLASGVNALGISITGMLVDNKKNGLILEDTSSILLENVNILNNNSSEAAAALEETAAAIEEITSNIISNTDNVSKMGSYANELTLSAKEGQKLAQETTLSMEEINTQVTAINEAITVIDQIAFQTNILSLNAAVEAATAGESGKGFAVVAQEVRNLAARSAEAAKEIKELVETATTKANSGKEIANKMIVGYNGLNENISKTIEIISDVEMASKEQQTGIEQINDAVTQLDQQTQQNALIAAQTHDVANQTDGISKLIVSNADEKEFEGKNNIKIKELRKSSKSTKSKEETTSPKKTKKVEPKVIKEQEENPSDEEWESF